MKIDSKNVIEKVLIDKVLPSHDFLMELTDTVSTILEEEITEYRQAASNESAGSLLDFQNNDLPTIVVPDLHGRTEFLYNIINYSLPKKFLKSGAIFDAEDFSDSKERLQWDGSALTVYEALEKGLVRLIFVGDILHTEKNTKMRWLLAQTDFFNENYTGPSMTSEMEESLALWCGVFMLKQAFPSNCHILKGNHENIYNASTDGDYAFKKYSNEGAMVKAFIQEYYGDDILYMIHCVEAALPLVVVGNNYVISHAEPREPFTKEQIIDGRLSARVVAGLTWTDNDEAEDGSVLQVIKNLSNKEDVSDYVYLGGHRCVKNTYELRQNGLYIQIHNPSKQNISLVYNDRKFNPDKDIVGVQK